MSVSSPFFDRNEASKNSIEFPTIYIQNPMNKRAYLLENHTLKQYILSKQDADNDIKTNGVTFYISDCETSVSPSLETVVDNDYIRILDLKTSTLFKISHQELCQYEVNPNDFNAYGIAFTLPIPSKLIQELPSMTKGLLQHSHVTSGPAQSQHTIKV